MYVVVIVTISSAQRYNGRKSFSFPLPYRYTFGISDRGSCYPPCCKVSNVVQGHDVMCAKADRCGTFTLPLPLLLLLPCYGRTDYGDDGIMSLVLLLLLLFVVVDVDDDDDDDVLLLAAAVAAVAAAYIGGNITCTLPYLTSGRYITLPYIPLAAVYVACLFSCLMTRSMSR